MIAAGNFVVAGNLSSVVIFLILTLIQFLVIASGRSAAEVAAASRSTPCRASR